MDAVIAISFFGGLGLVFLGTGLYLRSSNGELSKLWYSDTDSSIVMPRALKYILIPMGFLLLFVALAPLISATNRTVAAIYGYSLTAFLILTLVLGIWTPKWLLPNWLIWLEETYGVVGSEIMLSTIENSKEWAQRVSTQEGIEAWAEEAWQQLQAEQGKNGRHP